MMHFYTARRYGTDEYKTLCTDMWTYDVEFENTTAKKIGFTTDMTQVTCVKCLDLLIARKERELELMRKARNSGVPTCQIKS